MSKILLVGDTHWGVRNASDFYLQNQVKYYKRLFSYIEKNKAEIEVIVFLGDWLDNRRSTNIVVQNYMIQVLDKLESYGIPIYHILGNHDVYYKNSNKMNGMVPLLKYYKNHKLIDKKPLIVETSTEKLVLIPWANNENVAVISKFLNDIPDPENHVVCGHLSFPEWTVFTDELISSETFRLFKYVFSGHFHINVINNNIIYTGSILDFKWGEELSNHGFWILENGGYKIVKNPTNLHEKHIIESPEDLKLALDTCENKEIKLIITPKLDMKTIHYDRMVYDIDKKCYNLQVLLANDMFASSHDDFTSMNTFEEFLEEWFDGKNYGPTIDIKRLKKLFIKLYDSVKEE